MMNIAILITKGNIMTIHKRLSKVLIAGLMAGPSLAFADPLYSLTFLPQDFYAVGINNMGQVVGTAGGGAAIWSSPTSVTSLGSLLPGSEGLGINNRGDIVVNNADQVAGTGSWPVGEEFRGWVFSQGVLRMIGTFGGDFSEAYAINNAGQVVGLAALVAFRSPRGDHHAFLYRDRVLQDLGTLGDGVSSRANDINDAGQIVGASEYAYSPDTSGPIHPFLYQNRLMRDLGTLGGPNAEAYGINNAGAVVGYSDLADGMTAHAFLYENGKMRDLHRLTRMPQGWLLVGATDINDRRQVLARACLNEDCISVRLDPIPGTGG
jgi:probable HAF family extracellular repeat protein